jgi:nicotinate-nucleotide--dimethylbenzimidazole phosphoribosyltransferase
MDRQPFDDIRALIDELKPADAVARAAGLAALVRAMPAEEAGAFGAVVGWIAEWRGAPRVHRPIIALYAGAHAGPADATRTRERMEAIAAGAMSISRAAQHLGAGLDVFDLAIDRPVADPSLRATMSERECAATMAFGMEALAKQPDLLVLGAFGEGVDASASVLASAVSGMSAPEGFEAATERARGEAGDDPLQWLRQLGGRETAAICGAILAAGAQRTPVLLDGWPGVAAAAALHAVSPGAIAHCRMGHGPDDAGWRALAAAIGLSPLFDLGAGLGDGTGSTAVLSLIKLACALPLEA